MARLVGERAADLESLLTEAVADTAWFAHAEKAEKVFGDGHACERIARVLLGMAAAVECGTPTPQIRLAA